MATGYYHITNSLKLRIFNYLFRKRAIRGVNGPGCNAMELAEYFNVPLSHISKNLHHYYCDIHYLTRRKKQGIYVYRLGKLGLEYYKKYMNRFIKGYRLALRHKDAWKMPHYTGHKVIDVKAAMDQPLNPDYLKHYLRPNKRGCLELNIEMSKIMASIIEKEKSNLPTA
jgi:hypothetical protein